MCETIKEIEKFGRGNKQSYCRKCRCVNVAEKRKVMRDG
jgi:hypothetical protein